MTKISQLPTASSVDIGDASKLPLNSVNDFQTKGVTLEQLRDNYFGNIQTAKLTIASADVLTLNTTPIQFGLNVPSGYAARLLSLDGKIVYNSSTYATNGNLVVRCVGTTDTQAGWTGTQFLFATTSRTSTATLTSGTSATSNQLIDGADLEVFVSTGNPTTGDSDITLYITYRLINL